MMKLTLFEFLFLYVWQTFRSIKSIFFIICQMSKLINVYVIYSNITSKLELFSCNALSLNCCESFFLTFDDFNSDSVVFVLLYNENAIIMNCKTWLFNLWKLLTLTNVFRIWSLIFKINFDRQLWRKNWSNRCNNFNKYFFLHQILEHAEKKSIKIGIIHMRRFLFFMKFSTCFKIFLSRSIIFNSIKCLNWFCIIEGTNLILYQKKSRFSIVIIFRFLFSEHLHLIFMKRMAVYIFKHCRMIEFLSNKLACHSEIEILLTFLYNRANRKKKSTRFRCVHISLRAYWTQFCMYDDISSLKFVKQ